MSAAVSVVEHRNVAVASLRYFDPAGTFAGTVGDLLGRRLPANQQAVLTTAGDILAWRSPTETLLIRAAGATFADIAACTGGMTDGSLVEQTGGLSLFIATGVDVSDLMSRLGGAAAPTLGQCRVSRLADLPVTSLCVRAGETWLLVERVYAGHLRGWIDATLQDGML